MTKKRWIQWHALILLLFFCFSFVLFFFSSPRSEKRFQFFNDVSAEKVYSCNAKYYEKNVFLFLFWRVVWKKRGCSISSIQKVTQIENALKYLPGERALVNWVVLHRDFRPHMACIYSRHAENKVAITSSFDFKHRRPPVHHSDLLLSRTSPFILPIYIYSAHLNGPLITHSWRK